jgi:two-component system phosphate regulon response regulator PhoB
MSERTVLIIEDEVAIRDMLRMALEFAGFRILEAEDIHQGYAQIVDERPDITLLDWMLPGGSGLELLRRLKRDDLASDMPVIMLTAKTAEDNIVQGLEAGADDYITKPFAPREVVARIKALLRRTPVGAVEGELRVGDLVLDTSSKRISIAGQALHMGPTEFKLLEFFMTHPERAYTRSQLLDLVWGANVYVEERTVDVHIRRLRKTLQSGAGDCSSLIQTVRGTGYRYSTRELN